MSELFLNTLIDDLNDFPDLDYHIREKENTVKFVLKNGTSFLITVTEC